MNTRYRAVALAAWTALLLCGPQALSAQPLRYTFEMFAPTSNSESNLAEDLNNLGVGTGRMFTGSTTLDRAIVVQNGTTQQLGILPTTGHLKYSDGLGINDLGEVVGESSFGDNSFWRGFLYSNGTMQELGTLGGNTSSANAINNAGQVVGIAATASSGNAPFLWQNGTMVNLGSFGGNSGGATDINQGGDVVGFSRINSIDNRAFFFRDLNGNGQSDSGEMINLGAPPEYRESVAWGVNDAGQVTGTLLNGNVRRGFLWSDSNGNHLSDAGEMIVLPTLSGTNWSNPEDINLAGDIVGYSRTPGFEVIPTLWSGGNAYDLHSLIDLLPGQTMPLLDGAVAINDAGQILLTGHVPTSLGAKSRIYLLTPVPEPSTYALASLALASFIVGRLRCARHPRRAAARH